MRVLVVIVSLLTVNTIDCYSDLRHNNLDGLKHRVEEPLNSTTGSTDYVDLMHLVREEGNDLNTIERKAGDKQCSSVCGKCIKEKDAETKCGENNGKVDEAFSCKKGKVCCINGCPKTKGFFRPTGSQQCFRLLEGNYTWTQADDACRAAGLVLAHPFDAIGLRSYLIQRFGSDSNPWLGASGNGTDIYWQSSGVQLLPSNPLWYQGPLESVQPENVSPNCLALAANTIYPFWAPSQPAPETQRPYLANGCDWNLHALCELELY